MNKHQGISLAAVAFASLMSAASASASVIVTFDSVVPNPAPGGTGFLWSYVAYLQPDFNFRTVNTVTATPHDFFTIYDVLGLRIETTSFTPAVPYTPINGWGFTPTTQIAGFTPPKTAVDEVGILTNITVQLTAGGTISPNPAGAAVLLGTVQFVDDYGDITQNFSGYFSSLTEKKSNGTNFSTVGRLPLPTDGNGDLPEPSSAGLIMGGSLGLLGRRRR